MLPINKPCIILALQFLRVLTVTSIPPSLHGGGNAVGSEGTSTGKGALMDEFTTLLSSEACENVHSAVVTIQGRHSPVGAGPRSELRELIGYLKR